MTSWTATRQRRRIPKWRFVDDSAQVCVFIIEAMQRSDLPEVLAIERLSFASPWSRAAFEAELEKTYASLTVARLKGDGEVHPVLGYLCCWLVADEIQITNLAVHIGYRRRGVGRSLLLQACGRGYSAGARLAVLEVRESNKGARALYESLGFVAVQKRPRYYTEFREDALVMVLHLDRQWSQQWLPRN